MKGYIFLLISFCTIACATKNNSTGLHENFIKDTSLPALPAIKDTFEKGKIINVTCRANADQSYALYIPIKSGNTLLPVIYFFDPHGDGSFPVTKYTALAEAFNFIFIGSNNSKNGNDWPATENIWAALSSDSKLRLKIDTSRLYTCGFSGGAKVATYIALHNSDIKGVIANGAVLPDIAAANTASFSFTGITGEGDLNMTDMVAITNGLGNTQTKHRIIFFNGIHEWAPQPTMRLALQGLEFDAMRLKNIPVNNILINTYIDSSKKRITQFIEADNYIKAGQNCALSINLLEGLPANISWFIQKEAVIKNNALYQKQQQSQQELFMKEQKLKDIYNKQFRQGDENYWITTIADVKLKAKAVNAEGAMYQRLQAYLSLAFYSICNQLIKENYNADATYFTGLYKITDATNPEAWYLSAILSARNNDAKTTKASLIKAIKLGFADRKRVERQQEFQLLAAQMDLLSIEKIMK